MRCLVAYLSYSGNTKETAALIADHLDRDGTAVDMHQIGIDMPIDASVYDYLFLGTFTWDIGHTPEEVKDFVLEVGYKPDHVAVFGTGDTQFGGEELFCRAADKLAIFYNSKWPVLKVEQSPRGSQEKHVYNWVEGVLQHAKCFT